MTGLPDPTQPTGLAGLIGLLTADAALARTRELIDQRGQVDIVAPDGIRAAALAAWAGFPDPAHQAADDAGRRQSADAASRPDPGDVAADPRPGRSLVVVTPTTREAERLVEHLASFVPPDAMALLPAWETLPHELLSPRADTVAQRLTVLRRLAHPEPSGPRGPIRILVVPIRSILQPVIAGLGEIEPVALAVGDRVDYEALVARLVDAAYTRVDMVERRGEFAVRGSILDIFPPAQPHPLRVDFWGDDVEEICYFTVDDQRSGPPVPDGLWAPPCREILLTPTVRQRAEALISQLPRARELLEKLAAGIPAEGMESLAPVLADGMVSLLDLVDPGAALIVVDPERLRRRAGDLGATNQEFLDAAWANAASGNAAPLDLSGASFYSLAEVRATAIAHGLGWWTLSPFGLDPTAAATGRPHPPAGAVSDVVGSRTVASGVVGPAEATPDDDVPEDDETHLTLPMHDAPRFHGDIGAAASQFGRWVHDGWRVVVVTEGHGSAERVTERLRDADLPARLVTGLRAAPDAGLITVTTGLGRGFIAPDLDLAVVYESDITGRAGTSTKDMLAMPTRRRRNAVDPLQLAGGDLVVHEQHGVGRFVELVQRTMGSGANAATREYLVIEYAPSRRGQPGDRLYVPSDSLDQVTKYVGGDAVALNRLGGADWAKTKGRARRAVRQIAGELIRLYSARMASPGYAFGPDTPWQRELEDAFGYVETPDQLVTIDEVKEDMRKPVPMDRLICGDVGYGKTEIAVRAAFKAVQDGKQVAILVPTTLLVQQHMETFSERYAPFPVTVRPLSRFQSAADVAATKAALAQGSCDVVIGTHALIAGSVHFKDLGLVVIDEEQRFGVEHKETLKAMRTDVDVLSMSATPIPRTLEMAVSGIREMSTLATPPEERHPILTYVGPLDEKQIGAAIRRELLRDGQVFFVHNRVQSIEKTAARLADLVPEARVTVAHGKMNEHQLERTVLDFWEKRSDVLVCTTIIETGLDISNANTLIVDRAERLGLAQLHQLRGRVGRGRERAYAYFFYDPEIPLTETAHDRLATIAANTDLGAGMAVALKDLEIRGAGNLLGGEQSGHIAGVGFDLYLRMVSEAVAGFRAGAGLPSEDEDEAPSLDVKIELPVDAHIPRGYVDGDRVRLEAYTKLAAAADAARLASIREEFVDRFGPIPEPVENLFAVAELRLAARQWALNEITLQGKYVRFFPVELPDSRQLRLARLHRGSIIKPALRTILVPAPTPGGKLGAPPVSDADLLAWTRQLIESVIAGPGGGLESSDDL